MTLLETHEAALEDLLEEYDEAKEMWWRERLKSKIEDMRAAIERLKCAS